MTGTQLTIAALMAALASSGRGTITAETMRDMVATLQNAMGIVHVSTPITTGFILQDEWLPALGTCTPGYMYRMANQSGIDLIYTGLVPVMVHATFSFSAKGAAESTYSFAIAINGQVVEESIMTLSTPDGDNYYSGTLQTLIEMDTGDRITIYVRPDGHTNSIAIGRGQLVGIGYPM